MKNIHVYLAIWAILLALSCSRISTFGDSDNKSAGDAERISVNFFGRPTTKGSPCADENRVCNLNVWCYLDGKLDAWDCDEDGYCSVRLYNSRDYVILATANMDCMEPPLTLSDAMEYKYIIPDFSSDPFRNSLPMSTTLPVCINTAATGGAMPLDLSRLVAKYKLSIGKLQGTVSELEIKSVSIKNSPREIFCFKDNDACGTDAGGDFIIPEGNLDEAVLYLAENIGTEQLDKNSCTYVEIKGRLVYKDKPADDSVYILDQEMTYKWFLKDEAEGKYGVRRNGEYSTAFTWSDFGWLADPQHVNVDEIIDDSSYSIAFCNEEGVPLSGAQFDNLDHSSTFDIYFKAFPESEGSNIEMSTNIPPQSVHLSFIGKAQLVKDGIYRQTVANNVDRESPAELILTLTNAVRGISCSAKILLKGNGNCVNDWESQDNETINF